MPAQEYLRRILTARVYDVAIESPLEAAPRLSRRLDNRILFKREDLQPVFSFKLRGAYNKMAHMTPADLKRGVICASAGNHAQGVALSAQKLGTRAVIVMPETTPQIKIDAVRARGGELYVFADPDSGFESSDGVHVIKMPRHVSYFQAPAVYTIPLQLLAYHCAILKGTDVDQPRNLAKSVTVE